jgi:hypothetical protein
MLNDYQVQFLHHLIRHNVTFLVVRRQARWLNNNAHMTRDLDIWVSIADKDRPALERALIEWASKNPQHTNQNWASPLVASAESSNRIPRKRWGLVHGSHGCAERNLNSCRIDVLTSLEGMIFEECLARATMHNVDGATVHAMSPADLDQAAKFRFASEGRY